VCVCVCVYIYIGQAARTTTKETELAEKSEDQRVSIKQVTCMLTLGY